MIDEDYSTDNSESDVDSRTQKRKQMYNSSSDEDDEINSNIDNSLNQPVHSKDSKGTQPKSLDCLSENSIDELHANDSDHSQKSLHVGSTSLAPLQSNEIQSPLTPGKDEKADDDNDAQKDHSSCKDTILVSVQTDHTLPIHDILVQQLENDESMSLETFGNTHELAPSAKDILPYPPRSIVNWNEGWLLSLITKDRKAFFKPSPISFRVDRDSLIGSGRNMDCFKAELLLDNQVHWVVAKQRPTLHCPLAYYQCQAQTYVHVDGVIDRFKRDVLNNQKFTQLEKDLVKSLRIVKRWVVQIVGTEETHFMMKNDSSNLWLFEEELEGDFVKYVGNSDFTIKQPGDPLHEMLHALTHYDLDNNAGCSFICDLQGVGSNLTDPAVIDLDKTFSSGNLNYQGLELLIDQHEENSWCRNLGLKCVETWQFQLKK